MPTVRRRHCNCCYVAPPTVILFSDAVHVITEAKVSMFVRQLFFLCKNDTQSRGTAKGVSQDFSGSPCPCSTAGTGVLRNRVMPTHNNAIESSFTNADFIPSLAVLQS